MRHSTGKIVWRVHASDGKPHAAAFDALILAADPAEQEQLRPSRLLAVDAPYERELPSDSLTLIIRANSADTSLITECDVLRADGTRRAYGRSRNPLAVFVCSKRGIVVTGLAAPAASTSPTTW